LLTKKTIFHLTFPLLALVLVSSCASRGTIARFQKQLNYLETSNQRLERDVANLDSLLQLQLKETQRMTADINTSFGSVDERLKVVEGWLRDSDHRYSQLFKKVELAQEKTGDRQTLSPADTAVPQVNFDPQTLYDGAYMNMVKGSYDLAIQGFSDYLSYFPRSSLAPAAQYWIAECHYTKRDFTKASEEFKKLLQSYPKSEKIPTGLYKLGLIHLELGEKTLANNYFGELLDKYPGAPETELAREIMQAKD
jgi:tol-pal system protein YbgF